MQQKMQAAEEAATALAVTSTGMLTVAGLPQLLAPSAAVLQQLAGAAHCALAEQAAAAAVAADYSD